MVASRGSITHASPLLEPRFSSKVCQKPGIASRCTIAEYCCAYPVHVKQVYVCVCVCVC